MKAVVIESFGGSEALKIKDIQKPEAKENEVLIKVNYAGVNPVDFKIREGYLKDRIPHEFPIILGWDVAGTIEAIGSKVKNFNIGDEVFAYVRKPLVKWGAYCEYVTFDAKDVALKPHNTSFAQAAALPLVSLTAWQSIFDSAHLQPNESVLIHAGSGGVGSMAIQFARHAGAIVTTTASAAKQTYVKKLGAQKALDYKTNDFTQDKYDVIFDTVGGDVFKKSLTCLKPGGRIVSLLEHIDLKEAHYVFVSPNGAQLEHIAKLIEEGKVVVPNITEMKLEEVAKAHEALENGKVFGKLVLKVV